LSNDVLLATTDPFEGLAHNFVTETLDHLLVAVRLKPAATLGKGPPSWASRLRRPMKMGLSRR